MAAGRDDAIGPTAHYTAYAWRRLGMPYAEHFATPRGRALYWAFRGAGEWVARLSPRAPLLVDVLAYRHRLIDRELARIAPDRVVELGAGLSRRGLTFARDHGVDYLEIDLPTMVEAKRERLAHAPRAERLRALPHDILAPGFGAFLARELAGADRAVVIAEGVLGYFAEDERARIAGAVREGLASARSGAFLCDLRDRERTRRLSGSVAVLRGAIRLVTRGRGLREDFASEAAIRTFFAARGFSSAEPVLPGPSELAHLDIPLHVWRAE